MGFYIWKGSGWIKKGRVSLTGQWPWLNVFLSVALWCAPVIRGSAEMPGVVRGHQRAAVHYKGACLELRLQPASVQPETSWRKEGRSSHLSLSLCEFQSKWKQECWQFSAHSSSALWEISFPVGPTGLAPASREVYHSETSQLTTAADTLCTWCSCTAPSGPSTPRHQELSTPSTRQLTTHQPTALTLSWVWRLKVSKHFIIIFRNKALFWACVCVCLFLCV